VTTGFLEFVMPVALIQTLNPKPDLLNEIRRRA
jgi:hypothetical protein